MGSSGMKRKGRRHLPKVPDDGWPGADDTNGPLFGQFRWNAWSPAGTLERSAWFCRQVARNGTGIGWRWGFDAMRMLFPLLLWIAVTVAGLSFVLRMLESW